MTELLPPSTQKTRPGYGSSARRAWSADEIRALGTRTDLVTACRIVYGCGKNRAWELYYRAELPFPALRVGRRVVVPTAPLLALLCLTPDMSEAGVATPATATTDVPTDKRTAHDGTALHRHLTA